MGGGFCGFCVDKFLVLWVWVYVHIFNLFFLVFLIDELYVYSRPRM